MEQKVQNKIQKYALRGASDYKQNTESHTQNEGQNAY